MAERSKRGRPLFGDEPRIVLSVRVSSKTDAAITDEANKRDISRGAVVDEIVARALLRKRKT